MARDLRILNALFWVSIAAHYDFPSADRGIEVIGSELGDADQERAAELVRQFLKTTQCGGGLPVVTHEP